MRKGVVFVVALAVMTMLIGTGCTDKKEAKGDTLAVITDTIDTTSVDSLEEIIAETPMPKAADELFDDFFFSPEAFIVDAAASADGNLRVFSGDGR